MTRAYNIQTRQGTHVSHRSETFHKTSIKKWVRIGDYTTCGTDEFKLKRHHHSHDTDLICISISRNKDINYNTFIKK